MSNRNLDPTMAAALASGVIVPAILVLLTFKSGKQYVWSGVGPLVYGGNTYVGVGSLGTLGVITEGAAVKADGTTVTLSGIDPVMLQESMTDIRLGAPAKIWFGLMSGGVFLGTPYLVFSGTVDKPTVTTGAATVSISLALENRMVNLSRPTQRRYTSADQRVQYPNDMGFSWVEQLNDIALKEG